MATWGGHGLRGSTLEDMINRTNEAYRQNGLGLIQKVPTPITPVEMNQSRQIKLAYFEKKSTVDYIGAVQGIPVCFDAKECAQDTFPLQNVHAHQLSFMQDFERQRGVSFLILYYTHRDLFFYLPLRFLETFWQRMETGGRKSFKLEEMPEQFRVRRSGEYLCHYLEALDLDLRLREGMDAKEKKASSGEVEALR